MQVTVSIGRNIGDQPMSSDQWSAFRFALLDVLDKGEHLFTTSGRSHSRWGDEDSLTVAVDVLEEQIPAIRSALAQLAADYQQQTIALTIADPEFISATVRNS